jgi:hypothetical protein
MPRIFDNIDLALLPALCTKRTDSAWFKKKNSPASPK